MNATVRKSILQVHRWTGLTVGLLLIFLALTGLALVFRPHLEPVVHHNLLEVAPCTAPMPLDSLIANARAAHATGELDLVRIPGEPNASTMVRFTDNKEVFVNPCTGAVLGQQPRWGGVFGTMEEWHRFRFLKSTDVANFITGTAAIAMAFILVIAGIVIWWPRNLRSLKSAVTFRPHLRGRAFDLNLHQIVGLYASLVILAVAVTSLPLAFQWIRYGMFSAVGSPKPDPRPNASAPVVGARPLSMGAFWERTQSLVPHPAEAVLQLPRKPRDPVEIYVIESDAPHKNARTYLYLDAYTGDVLRFEPYAATSLGNRIYRWSASLHSGEVGGVFGQLLQFLGILGVPVLGYTGFSSYLRRRSPVRVDTPKLKVRVEKVRSEAEDIKSFELVIANGAALPSFTPGAHINVKIDENLVRQYSLCNDPADQGRYLIAVKRVPDSRGGSQTLHEEVNEGDTLSISAPRNHFPLDPSAKHHLLLAGGIGVTPLLCMARHLQRTGASFALQYFTRSIEHTAFHDVLSQPEFRGKVAFHYSVEPERLHEYLHKLLWHRPDGAHLYVCGPRPFMDLVEATAASTWPPEAVHIEYFTADPMASAGPREAFEITLARAGGTYTVPADKSIVDVLTENGIENMTSCSQGVCGTCLTGVLEGTPDHRDVYLSEAERRACDKIMLCVSRAKSKTLVLDL
jgi:ferredoxin-NADP reductase